MIGRRAFLAGAVPFAAGCVTEQRLASVPHEISTSGRDHFLNIPNARFLVGARDADIQAEWFRVEGRRVALGLAGDYHILALSGGGADGAFGAGLLNGWSERGDRPVFEMVTGISTGALIAPLAFLGKAYDADLRRLYTTISDSDIVSPRGIPAALFSDAFNDSAPLAQLIERTLTDDMIREIGKEYLKGRFLIVGTTNLDLGRQVIWNIGALASSGRPEAFQAIRRILLASASIPGLFPPVLFDIEIDGQRRQELHVDGGAAAQIFLYPTGLSVRNAPAQIRNRRRIAWIVRNGRTRDVPAETERSLTSISTRAISTLIGANSQGDIYRIYVQTRRDKVDFNLAYIRGGFSRVAKTPFDREYMNELYEFGRRRMREDRVWVKSPPGFAL